jgi:hypothetical protein
MQNLKKNQIKSMHITFTLSNQTCPTTKMGNIDLPQKNEMIYLVMHLDRRLTLAKHIKTKENSSTKKQKPTWLLGRSTLSIESKFFLYEPYGPMEFSYWRQPPITTSKSAGAFKPRLSHSFCKHLGT